MQTFYLISTELRTGYSPRRCITKSRLKTKLRNDVALVQILPPIPKEIYHSSADISELLLATRLKKTSLFTVTKWPVYVYICLPSKNILSDGKLQGEDFSIVDWGAAYLKKEDALRSLEKRHV